MNRGHARCLKAIVVVDAVNTEERLHQSSGIVAHRLRDIDRDAIKGMVDVVEILDLVQFNRPFAPLLQYHRERLFVIHDAIAGRAIRALSS